MNVVISIEHPAWAHQFRYVIKELIERGDNVTVLAVDKDGDLTLLEKFNIPYKLMANSTGRNTFEKAWLFAKLCLTYTIECKKSKADVLIGRLSPMMSVAAFFCGRPHIIFDDNEISVFGIKLAQWFSTVIITPRCFYKNLGKKQLRVPMFKELYYLDKRCFKPDESVPNRFGIDTKEKYVIVRFVAWNASHDFGHSGMTTKEKIEFINSLSEIARVYISSEGILPPELEKFGLNTPFEHIHHIMYYAQMVITDGSTMASEAVAMGTHAIRLSSIQCGTAIEQEQYGLLKRINGVDKKSADEALAYVRESLKRTDFWNEGKNKRELLLKDMVDCNQFFINTMDEVVNNGRKKMH